MHIKLLLFSTLSFLAVTALASAHAPTIREVSLSQAVIEREPSGPFNSQLSCDDAGQAPTISASDNPIVYLWTKVNNDEPRVISHIWEHFNEGNWEAVAEVPLQVGRSVSWRTWSSKNLDSFVHPGAWRVFVVAEDMPNQVLCSIYFNVQQ